MPEPIFECKECGRDVQSNEKWGCPHETKKSDDAVASELNTWLSGNGNNEFAIVIKCKYEVYREEWAELLMLLNQTLQNYDNGKFSNVGAFLEEAR